MEWEKVRKVWGGGERKRYGHKKTASANCNNRSDNRPGLPYRAFSRDKKTNKKHAGMRLFDLGVDNILSLIQSIPCMPLTFNLVAQATEGSGRKD